MLPPPTIHEAPTIDLMDPPSPMVMTLKDISYFYETCEAYSTAGQEGFHSAEEIMEMTNGLTEDDACGFAVYGLPTQQWLNMEADINTIVSGLEQLRILLRGANKQMTDQFEIISRSAEEIKTKLEGVGNERNNK